MDNKGKWVGLLAGAAAGGIIGVLLTTDKGDALRKKLVESAGLILSTILEKAQGNMHFDAEQEDRRKNND